MVVLSEYSFLQKLASLPFVEAIWLYGSRARNDGTDRKAYQFQLINDEKVWLSMLDDRNLTSHIYQQEEAKKIFQRIISYWPVMNNTYQRLEKKFSTYIDLIL